MQNFKNVFYCLVKDEQEESKVKHEQLLCQKYVKDVFPVEFYVEYGDSEDIKRPIFTKIINRCVAREIVYLFIGSLDCLSRKRFTLMYETIVSCGVVPLLVTEKAEWIRLDDMEDAKTFYTISRNHFVKGHKKYLEEKK